MLGSCSFGWGECLLAMACFIDKIYRGLAIVGFRLGYFG